MRTPALCDTRSYAVAAVLKPRGALSRPQTLLDCSGRHALIASPHHVGFPSLQEVLAPAEAAPPQMLVTLRRFVNAESPSLEKAAADRCCGVIAEEWNRHGARVERISQKHRGDLLRITHAPGKSRPSGQLLVLGHYDTVYSTGTLARMPFRLKGGKAYGP